MFYSPDKAADEDLPLGEAAARREGNRRHLVQGTDRDPFWDAGHR